MLTAPVLSMPPRRWCCCCHPLRRLAIAVTLLAKLPPVCIGLWCNAADAHPRSRGRRRRHRGCGAAVTARFYNGRRGIACHRATSTRTRCPKAILLLCPTITAGGGLRPPPRWSNPAAPRAPRPVPDRRLGQGRAPSPMLVHCRGPYGCWTAAVAGFCVLLVQGVGAGRPATVQAGVLPASTPHSPLPLPRRRKQLLPPRPAASPALRAAPRTRHPPAAAARRSCSPVRWAPLATPSAAAAPKPSLLPSPRSVPIPPDKHKYVTQAAYLPQRCSPRSSAG